MTSTPRVWVLCTGEPLPIDPGVPRLLRAGMLCEFLEQSGYEVDFWTSNFDHVTKNHRAHSKSTVVHTISAHRRIRLLPSSGYLDRVSLARVWDHRQIARAFLRDSKGEPKPDILVISMPTIDLAFAGARYAHANRIPYILDLRDLWPEVFYMDRKTPVKRLLQVATTLWSFQLNWALRHAQAVVGITESFVEWGCKRSDRKRRPEWDIAIPLTYPKPHLPTPSEELEQSRLIEANVLRPDLFQVCFLGSISNRMDLATLCQSVVQAESLGLPLHLVVAGTGEALDHLQSTFRTSHISFLGRVDQTTIQCILRTSKVGVVPYHNSLDFRMSIPNKVIEYLSHARPILTCLQGDLASMMRTHDVGVTYEEGNPQSLVNRLQTYMQHSDLLERQSTNARSIFDHVYAPDIVLEKYTNLIQSVIKQGGVTS